MSLNNIERVISLPLDNILITYTTYFGTLENPSTQRKRHYCNGLDRDKRNYP